MLPFRDLPLTQSMQANAPPVRQKLIICSAPRTMSTTFCSHLTAAGMAAPDEYFGREEMQRTKDSGIVEDWSVQSYVDLLYNARSRDGLFATKLQFGQFLASLTNPVGQNLFDDAVVVKLVRSDVRAQVVSDAAASCYHHWSNDFPNRPTTDRASFFYPSIRAGLNAMLVNEAGWQAFFAFSGVTPILVAEKMMLSDMRGVIHQIACALGREVDDERLNYRIASDSGRYTALAQEKAQISAEAERVLSPIAFHQDTYRHAKYPRPYRSPLKRLRHRLFGRPHDQ